ncbi:polysaccharide biosynthesis C-terminal domain-containing protein [Pedobacter sp.]|uniref:lipopolysaccharide biosynthesis protein n=1 Tax=Pedobacter sp. TaxID=1411316 RepID=UPI0031D70213
MNKKVVANVLSSGGQIACIGVVYFFLYKYLLKQLGVEMLGVWSVVMATSSIANIANFGVATSVVRFVALYLKEDTQERINELIFTAVIFIAGFFSVLGLIILPSAHFILSRIIDVKYVDVALKILPFSLICLIVNAIAGVYASVLDGMQKNYIRSLIFTLSSIVLLGLTFLLTPAYGLKGVVFAQLAQSVFTILGCLFLVMKITKYNQLKWQWNKEIFKEIFAYGIKFQVISISAMLNEPVTKLLMAKFGGLQFTGYYEMANRLIMQLRGVIINANQSLMPLMVKSSEDQRLNKVNNLYKINFLAVAAVSLILLTIPVLASNVIAKVWIGHHESMFDLILLLTAVSMYVNLLCGPAYFSLLAEGILNPVIKSQIIIGVLNLILGFVLGKYFGGMGVVFGWLLAVLLGTVYLIRNYAVNNKSLSKFKLSLGLNLILVTTLSFLILKHFNNNFFSRYASYEVGYTMGYGLICLLFLFLIYKEIKNYDKEKSIPSL